MKMIVIFMCIVILSFQGLCQDSKFPIGATIPFMGDTSVVITNYPEWILCDGRSLKIEDYPQLFESIGWNYGYGDNKSANERNNFSCPDLRGYFLRGYDGGTKRDKDYEKRTANYNENLIIGDAVGSVQGDSFKNHSHTVQINNYGGLNPFYPCGQGGTQNVESSLVGGTETRPINICVYYLIKAK